jgi:hypothetical protein
MFWVTVYHSKLPYFKEQAKFIHDTIKISVWKVGWQTDSAIQVIYQVAASCRVIDTTYQLASVVAPRMPRLQQLGPELKLKPAERSQLVTAVGTPQTFKVGENAWQSSVRLSSIGCGWQVFLPVGWDTGVDAVCRQRDCWISCVHVLQTCLHCMTCLLRLKVDGVVPGAVVHCRTSLLL